MQKVILGRTGLEVTKTSFGVLPIQRVSLSEAERILRRAYEAGINFYDTANAYTDSEMKIGYALGSVRDDIVIATKSGAKTRAEVLSHIENSLRMLRCDYIDLFQFHNPAEMPDPDDPDGAFAAALEAKARGYIRHIGITNHRLPLAEKMVRSGLFETMQYPFSYLASPAEEDLVRLCAELDVGFIAMKGLAGGLLTDAACCSWYMRQFDNVVPIWGIQRMEELEEWISLENSPPELTDEMARRIEQDRRELSGSFCRGCGYCAPCPVGINIANDARMSLLLRRAPYKNFLDDRTRDNMRLINNCINCRSCVKKCPYSLDTPALLRENLADYEKFYAEHKGL